MRVVALLVVACGCRTAASSAVDAPILVGDGLPERIVTDVALWSDLALPDASGVDARPDGASDRSVIDSRDMSDGAATLEGGQGQDPGAGQDCSLLTSACVGDEGCYPFPFEGTPDGRTRCAFQGVSSVSIPCQSQLECDGTTLCSAPGQPDSVCLKRCDLANPRCPTKVTCTPFPSYAGVGVCL